MNYVKVCTHMYILQTGSSCLIMYMCAYTLYSTLLITINFLGYYGLKGPQGRKRWGRKGIEERGELPARERRL